MRPVPRLVEGDTFSMRRPWYSEGLRFTCTRCGDCCTGEEGFVWVNDEEISALAARLQLSTDEFRQRFTRRVGRGVSLIEAPDGACVFWNRTNGCTVYDDRPRQCRTWPFWNSNIRSERDWQDTERVCPGAGHGQLFTMDEITERARRISL